MLPVLQSYCLPIITLPCPAGGAWYRQKVDFANFPGSVLVTTNCVLDPLQSYKDNVFTANEVRARRRAARRVVVWTCM